MSTSGSEMPLPATLASLIMHCEQFINTRNADGTLLRCGEQYWRFQQGTLVPASVADYRRAVDSDDRSNWPPYTICFEVQPGSTSDQLSVSVDVTYDCGITEFSRGGSCSTWQLQKSADGWQILDIEYDMFSD